MTNHLKDATPTRSAALAAFSEPAGELAEKGSFSREVVYREDYSQNESDGGNAGALLPILALIGLIGAIAFALNFNHQPSGQQSKVDQLQQEVDSQKKSIDQFKACASQL
jgi:hypothetical protein